MYVTTREFTKEIMLRPPVWPRRLVHTERKLAAIENVSIINSAVVLYTEGITEVGVSSGRNMYLSFLAS